MMTLYWRLKLPLSHFVLLITLNQQRRELKYWLITKGKLDYFSTVELKKSLLTIQDPLGCLSELPCPIIKVNGKLPQPNPDRTTKDSDPSGIKI